MTNADKIKAMSDGELARFIENIAERVVHGNYCNSIGMNGDEKAGCYDSDHASDCVDCTLAWLKSEVTPCD